MSADTQAEILPDNLSGADASYTPVNPFVQITRANMDLWRRGVLTMLELTSPVSPPELVTPSEVILDTPQGALREYVTERSNPNYRVLILPPQAGHGPEIADYANGQSLVQVALDAGATAYTADWHEATAERRNEIIDDFIEATRQMVEKIAPGDEKVDLVGLCQGGWQAAIFAALYPEKVRSLTLAGSPINFDKGNGIIKRYARELPLEFFQRLVAMGGGNMPGEFMLMGWKSMHPGRDILDALDVFNNIDDPHFMERRDIFQRWFLTTKNLPGRAYLQIIDELFRRNLLVQGKLSVGDRQVDLSHIDCPVTLIAGGKDDITLVDQVMDAANHVGTDDVTQIVIPDAGHIGLFMGKGPVNYEWKDIFARLAPNTRR